MLRDDLKRDEELHHALRELDRASVGSPEDVERLHARITASAALLLDRRRHPPAPWWEYAAVWARPVVKVGIATALAAILSIAWAGRESTQRAQQRAPGGADTVSGADESAAVISQQQMLFTLVAPVEEQVLPALQPGKR
jgi:hypothetical protein